MRATIGRKLLIIWDRLQAHRSRLVRQHVETQRDAIALEYLPAYAPELHPVECIWGYLKQRARRSLRSMQRRPMLVRAFSRQAEPF
jgi:transposase